MKNTTTSQLLNASTEALISFALKLGITITQEQLIADNSPFLDASKQMAAMMGDIVAVTSKESIHVTCDRERCECKGKGDFIISHSFSDNEISAEDIMSIPLLGNGNGQQFKA